MFLIIIEGKFVWIYYRMDFCFCLWQEWFTLIYSRDRLQRFTPLQTCDTPQTTTCDNKLFSVWLNFTILTTTIWQVFSIIIDVWHVTSMRVTMRDIDSFVTVLNRSFAFYFYIILDLNDIFLFVLFLYSWKTAGKGLFLP